MGATAQCNRRARFDSLFDFNDLAQNHEEFAGIIRRRAATSTAPMRAKLLMLR
jgi:hypothetical protein